jgi:hypothetical protein
MAKNAYYRHLDGQRHRCEVIEETETQVKVRLSEESARELRLNSELWLPKSYVKIGEETRADEESTRARATWMS